MTEEEVVEEWQRRRRRLYVLHAVFLTVVGGGLLAAYLLGPPAVSEFIESWSLALALGSLALYLPLVFSVCKCPNCGRYPGHKPRTGPYSAIRTRVYGRGPFDFTYCVHCGVALVEEPEKRGK